ncbi:MAG: type II toxin-antitoxin system VapC family toxin [Nocardioidaceae bacterium]
MNAGAARDLLGQQQLHVPHVVDDEVGSALRRRVLAGVLTADARWDALDAWRRLALTRYPVFTLLDRVWELRENLSAYDASYVALAESLGCALVTADGRMSRAPGLACPVTVLPG